MITVLHYAPGFRTGGIESRLLDWYRNIDRSKVRFVLIKLNPDDDTPNIREFLALGGRFYDLPPFTFKTAFDFSGRIRKILRKERADLVHVHDVNSGIFVLREAKRLALPCRILHSRTTSNLPKEKNVWIKAIFRKLAPGFATHYFACSVEAGEWGIGKRYIDRIHILKNGIQLENFLFDPKTRLRMRQQLGLTGKKVIGTVGRLSDQKNLPFLLDIFRQMLALDPSYRLMIVGDGDRKILTTYFAKYPISDDVILTGNQKDVWDYYMAFDIFCGTSLYEGFGATAIEAQACGLPTLVSTAFPETVVVTDFAFRLPINDMEPWLEKISEFIGQRYPEEGLRGVRKHGYDAKRIAKELETFYRENSFSRERDEET